MASQVKEAEKRVLHKKKKTKIRVPYKDDRTDIMNLQEQLYNLGFFDNDYYHAVDGIIGKKTRAAIDKAFKNGYIVKDNKLTERTFKPATKPLDGNGNFTEECAAFVNGLLQKSGISAWGNSYELNKNDFSKVANGYDNLLKPKDITYSNLSDFQH